MTKHEELRKLLDNLNTMERHEASRIVTEILKYIMDTIQPERSKREDFECDFCQGKCKCGLRQKNIKDAVL